MLRILGQISGIKKYTNYPKIVYLLKTYVWKHCLKEEKEEIALYYKIEDEKRTMTQVTKEVYVQQQRNNKS